MNLKKHLIDFIKHPRARAVSLFFLAHGLMISTYVAQIPYFKSLLQLNDSELGNVLLGLPLGVIIMNAIAGWLFDKIGVWNSMIGSFVLYSILIIFVLLSESYWAFFVNLVLVGIAIGMLVVGSNTLAARIEKSEKIFVMSTCHAFFSLGAMLGGAISSVAITNHFPAEYQMGIFIALFAVLIFSNKKHLTSIPREKKLSEGISFGLPNMELLLLIIIGLGFAFAEGMVVDWSAVFLRDEVGMTEGNAPLGYSACALTMMIIRLSGDVLIPKFGIRKLLFTGSVVTFLGILLLVLFQNPIVGILSFGIIGLGVGLGVPLLMTLAARSEGFSDGAGVSIFAMFAFMGFIIEPPMVGWIAELSSLEWGIGVAGLLCLLGGVLALRIKSN